MNKNNIYIYQMKGKNEEILIINNPDFLMQVLSLSVQDKEFLYIKNLENNLILNAILYIFEKPLHSNKILDMPK